MLAARNDFTVFFDGDAFPCQIQRFDQLGKRERCREDASFAVDGQFNHNFYPGMSFSMMPNSTLKGAAIGRASYSGIT